MLNTRRLSSCFHSNADKEYREEIICEGRRYCKVEMKQESVPDRKKLHALIRY